MVWLKIVLSPFSVVADVVVVAAVVAHSFVRLRGDG